MSKSSNQGYKKFIKFLAGSLVLVIGVTLLLMWWSELVIVFKGTIGFIVAIAGLLILYSIKD